MKKQDWMKAGLLVVVGAAMAAGLGMMIGTEGVLMDTKALDLFFETGLALQHGPDTAAEIQISLAKLLEGAALLAFALAVLVAIARKHGFTETNTQADKSGKEIAGTGRWQVKAGNRTN